VHVVPSNFMEVFPEHENHSLDDHGELLSALATRDAPRAREIAEHHVLDAGRSLATWLDQASATAGP
jgi:DNA-binding GntR family transcriptional regulator